MSEEILKSELDIFKKLSFQKSIENSQIIQYRPTSALSESSIIEFDIPISSDEYLDLQNVYLWLKGSLVTKTGTKFASSQDERYSLINYSLNTIFDQLSIFLGGTLVSQSSNTYHYLSYIEAITQTTPTTGSTLMRSAGFVPPKAEYDFDAIDKRLFIIVKQSKVFTLYGKIHGAIFNSDKLLLNGLNLRLIFTRASNPFFCVGKAADTAGGVVTAAEPILNLSDICIYARKVKITPNLLIAHNKALKISKAVYPIKRSIVKVINLPSNQNTFVIDNLFIGQMPCKLIVGCVSNDSYSGSYTTNPLKFNHHNLSFICTHLNGEMFPKTPYQPDYRDSFNNYEREYYDFFMNIGANSSLTQPDITYENYKSGYCLYCFNFNSDFETNDESDYINQPKSGFLNIELKFSSNLAKALKLICYAKFDNVIEIDENRNVTVDYSG